MSRVREIPYPAVFHGWNGPDERVSVVADPAGIGVEVYLGDHVWKRVVLDEEDACLLAARLLALAGEKKLSKRVLKR